MKIRLEDMENYTDRNIEPITIKALGEASVTTTDSSGFGVGPEIIPLLGVGKHYILECKGFNQIAGLMDADTSEYLFRRTDQYFEDQYREFVEDHNRRKAEALHTHRGEWQARQDALPSPFKERLEGFHERGGDDFRLEGWGYELTVCELADMYARNVSEAEIDAFADKHGTSGNQHNCAQFLAKHRMNDEFLRAPAALAPLGGNW